MRCIQLYVFYLISQLFTTGSAQKTFHYGVTGGEQFGRHEPSTRLSRFQSTPVSLNPLEDTLRVQQILKKLEDPGGLEIRRRSTSRRLHGVLTEPFGTPLVISGNSSEKKKKKPLKIKKRNGRRNPKSPEVNEYELQLAKQIEEDQLKFVEDEKNPMKYVVENGLLFRQSRYSPLARVEIPPVSGMSEISGISQRTSHSVGQTMQNPPRKRRRKQSYKLKNSKSSSESMFRTNVFRGNINRQIPAIPLPSPFSVAYGKPSFAIAREEDGKCYTNRFGYRCCDEALEALILKSYEKLRRKSNDLEDNLSKIASTLRRDSRQVFAKNLEAIVSTSNFGTSIPSDFSCKVELGPNRFVAQVFVPELGLDAKTTTRRHRIPYHELSREDLSDAADLVVSRNGIIVSKLL
ncbi:Ground-like domain-containing protein [Caenorhabditis elegans]|uniref:Ground-like domain-containing protein n=1 Tax=Caenorhabditis elegans TaxID=6239 RepID=Q9N2Z2_CAEEL|nr:Ground-like domain-containing protein [Caenorhabditis elegans]CCD65523.1 Ground-like domain-containing protein [Caenorhabditis elegans]|eukprot:NP_500209.2 GRounDhog (hedgehog-like family) [Caenorhabditis elegans]